MRIPVVGKSKLPRDKDHNLSTSFFNQRMVNGAVNALKPAGTRFFLARRRRLAVSLATRYQALAQEKDTRSLRRSGAVSDWPCLVHVLLEAC